jgi:prephenate dehydrogenase
MAALSQVAIIGLGLMGSSLGLALHRLPRPPRVVGFDIDPDHTRQALRLRAVDAYAGALDEVVRDADLVVIAVPVRSVEAIFRDIAAHLRHGCVVTDTGSTKQAVCAWASELLPSHAAFVGGHPMTGRLTGGVAEASADLFQGVLYCLTPGPSTSPQAIDLVVQLVQSVGAHPYFLDPREHDSLVAGISHLPYLIASTLVDTLAAERGWQEMSTLAAGGFATTARLAEGDPQMYADICLTNREAILHYLDRYLEALTEVRAAIARGDEGLRERFHRAQQRHREWRMRREDGQPSASRAVEMPSSSLLVPRGLDRFLGRRDDQPTERR